MSEQNTKDTPFKRWYDKNKTTVAERRKTRYATDPAYREKVKQQSAQTRAKKKAPEKDPQYKHTQAQVAEWIGVSIFVLRSWRDKNYYPTPYSHGGRYYFTDHQQSLLAGLKAAVAAAKTENDLKAYTDSLYVNW